MSTPERSPLDPSEIRRLAGSRWNIDVVEQTGSTNADLLARAGAGEDIRAAVLLAESQSAGRGRHGRSWEAPPRAQVAMSVGVDAAAVAPDAWGWLPLLTGVALVDAVQRTCGVRAGLKWPNDVLVGEGKLAGILAEVAAPEPVIVIGLGVNVSLTSDELPVPTATSLTLLDHAEVDRNLLAANILDALADRIAAWQAAGGADAKLVTDYRDRSVTLSSRVRVVLPGERELVGSAVDVDALGRLVIDDGTGPTAVAAGDVTHLRAH